MRRQRVGLCVERFFFRHFSSIQVVPRLKIHGFDFDNWKLIRIVNYTFCWCTLLNVSVCNVRSYIISTANQTRSTMGFCRCETAHISIARCCSHFHWKTHAPTTYCTHTHKKKEFACSGISFSSIVIVIVNACHSSSYIVHENLLFHFNCIKLWIQF